MKRRFVANARTRISVVILLLLVPLVLGKHTMAALKVQSVDTSKWQSVNQDVTQLIAILRDERLRKSEPEHVVQVIQRLGQMRAVEAIDDLIVLLAFKQPLEWEKEEPSDFYAEISAIGPDRRYPAIGALFQIGKPALPALINVIATHENGSLESENALYTIFAILREEPPSAWVEYLRESAAHASSPEATQRLLHAAESAEETRLFMVLSEDELRQTDPDRVVEAIERLGERKAVKAIDKPAQIITFERPLKMKDREGKANSETQSIPMDRRFPAISALTQIGKPALPALIRVIDRHEGGSPQAKSNHKRSVHSPNWPFAENTVFTGLMFVGSETQCTNVVCFDLVRTPYSPSC
jgi:hypothetical protein